MKRPSLAPLLAATLFLLASAGGLAPSAHADGGWRQELEAVCGFTDAAMTLTKEELKGLIERCDRLKTSIEAEEETVRKVYLRRLKSCRDLYAYVLETRSAEKEPPGGDGGRVPPPDLRTPPSGPSGSGRAPGSP